MKYDRESEIWREWSGCDCSCWSRLVIHLSILHHYTSTHSSTMASASGYNHHRFSRAVLKKSRKWEASLTLEFHSNNWKFEHSVCPLPLLIKDKLTSGNDIHVWRSDAPIPARSSISDNPSSVDAIPLRHSTPCIICGWMYRSRDTWPAAESWNAY